MIIILNVKMAINKWTPQLEPWSSVVFFVCYKLMMMISQNSLCVCLFPSNVSSVARVA